MIDKLMIYKLLSAAEWALPAHAVVAGYAVPDDRPVAAAVAARLS